MNLKIMKFKNVNSTNDIAIKLIQKGKLSSGLVVSKKQKKGRGTMGKKWISIKGNLFLSIFFKVDLKKIKIENFLDLNANIIKKILNHYSKNMIKIKKPNDLIIKKRKICGILQEIVNYKKNKYLIVGIGINTNSSPKSEIFFSTSLKEISGVSIKNLKIVREIKIIYEKLIDDLKNYNFAFIKKKYI